MLSVSCSPGTGLTTTCTRGVGSWARASVVSGIFTVPDWPALSDWSVPRSAVPPSVTLTVIPVSSLSPELVTEMSISCASLGTLLVVSGCRVVPPIVVDSSERPCDAAGGRGWPVIALSLVTRVAWFEVVGRVRRHELARRQRWPSIPRSCSTCLDLGRCRSGSRGCRWHRAQPIAFSIVVMAFAVWVRAAAWVTLEAIALRALRRRVRVCSTAACASCIWPGVLRLWARSSRWRGVALRRGSGFARRWQLRAARAAQDVEEVLAALLGLLHDRRDVRVVVAQGPVRAGLRGSP